MISEIKENNLWIFKQYGDWAQYTNMINHKEQWVVGIFLSIALMLMVAAQKMPGWTHFLTVFLSSFSGGSGSRKLPSRFPGARDLKFPNCPPATQLSYLNCSWFKSGYYDATVNWRGRRNFWRKKIATKNKIKINSINIFVIFLSHPSRHQYLIEVLVHNGSIIKFENYHGFHQSKAWILGFMTSLLKNKKLRFFYKKKYYWLINRSLP